MSRDELISGRAYPVYRPAYLWTMDVYEGPEIGASEAELLGEFEGISLSLEGVDSEIQYIFEKEFHARSVKFEVLGKQEDKLLLNIFAKGYSGVAVISQGQVNVSQSWRGAYAKANRS